MKIVRILNNNILQARDKRREVIIQGRGVAFGKKSGDSIEPDKSCKVYELTDSRQYQYVKTLVDVIPAEYWDYVSEVQRLVEKELNVALNSNFYFSLLDHIYVAVQRAKKNITLTDFFSPDIKLYYRDLYDLSRKIVSMTEEKFQVKFLESEVYFVATHLLDATFGMEKSVSFDTACAIIDCVLEHVKSDFPDTIEENSIDYNRFLSHLRLFAGRVIASNKEKSARKFEKLTVSMKKEFPKQAVCLEEIVQDMEQRFSYQISSDEQFYLMIHICKITEVKQETE